MNSLDWLDTNDIAIELSEKFSDIDPQWISFPDLHRHEHGEKESKSAQAG